jgi:hypothetical protein
MINFEFFVRKVQYSCLIEGLLNCLTCGNERPLLFSHEPDDMMALSQLYGIDKEENFNQI